MVSDQISDADRALAFGLDNFPRGIGRQLVHEFARTHVGPRLHALGTDFGGAGRWSAHVTKMYAIMLMRKAKSWFTGYNSNVPGHEHGKVRYFVYNGGTPKYVAAINDVVAKDYEGSCSTPARGPR